MMGRCGDPGKNFTSIKFFKPSISNFGPTFRGDQHRSSASHLPYARASWGGEAPGSETPAGVRAPGACRPFGGLTVFRGRTVPPGPRSTSQAVLEDGSRPREAPAGRALDPARDPYKNLARGRRVPSTPKVDVAPARRNALPHPSPAGISPPCKVTFQSRSAFDMVWTRFGA